MATGLEKIKPFQTVRVKAVLLNDSGYGPQFRTMLYTSLIKCFQNYRQKNVRPMGEETLKKVSAPWLETEKKVSAPCLKAKKKCPPHGILHQPHGTNKYCLVPYVMFFKFLVISFQMKNNDDMWL